MTLVHYKQVRKFERKTVDPCLATIDYSHDFMSFRLHLHSGGSGSKENRSSVKNIIEGIHFLLIENGYIKTNSNSRSFLEGGTAGGRG